MTRQEIAKYIDHTILLPDATLKMVKKVCDEAKQYGFASVCVNPTHAAFVAAELSNSGVATCVVIGFPLGASTPEVKAFEVKDAIDHGAQELDMVADLGAVKSGRWAQVEADIGAVVEAACGRAVVKVIIETCLLTDEEKVKVCEICKAAGADFVKTSTGFSSGGATTEDIRLMRRAVGEHMGVKASGGIRDFDKAKAMLEAGANRLGCTASVHIVTGE